MEKPSTFQRILSHVQQLLPKLGAASTVLGAGQNAPNILESSSSSTRRTAADIQTSAVLLRQQYQKQLRDTARVQFIDLVKADSLGTSIDQYLLLKKYGSFRTDFSTFDWSLFDRYTPDEFRQTFPEYYI